MIFEYRDDHNNLILRAEGPDEFHRKVIEVIDPNCELDIGDTVAYYTEGERYLYKNYWGGRFINSPKNLNTVYNENKSMEYNQGFNDGKIGTRNCPYRFGSDERNDYWDGWKDSQNIKSSVIKSSYNSWEDFYEKGCKLGLNDFMNALDKLHDDYGGFEDAPKDKLSDLIQKIPDNTEERNNFVEDMYDYFDFSTILSSKQIESAIYIKRPGRYWWSNDSHIHNEDSLEDAIKHGLKPVDYGWSWLRTLYEDGVFANDDEIYDFINGKEKKMGTFSEIFNSKKSIKSSDMSGENKAKMLAKMADEMHWSNNPDYKRFINDFNRKLGPYKELVEIAEDKNVAEYLKMGYDYFKDYIEKKLSDIVSWEYDRNFESRMKRYSPEAWEDMVEKSARLVEGMINPVKSSLWEDSKGYKRIKKEQEEIMRKDRDAYNKGRKPRHHTEKNGYTVLDNDEENIDYSWAKINSSQRSQANLEGYNCGHKGGGDLSDNPYDKDTQNEEWNDWRGGYSEGDEDRIHKPIESRYYMDQSRKFTLAEVAQYLAALFFDLRTIHFNCTGDEFYTYHALAEELYEKTEDYYDDMVETAIGFDSDVSPMYVLPGDWIFVNENENFDTNQKSPQKMISERLKIIYDVLENVNDYDSMVQSKIDGMMEFYDKEIYKLTQALK